MNLFLSTACYNSYQLLNFSSQRTALVTDCEHITLFSKNDKRGTCPINFPFTNLENNVSSGNAGVLQLNSCLEKCV